MTQIVSLTIENFRGLRSMHIPFEVQQTVICLIGRGDSGKTTILEAIAAVFSPRWNLSFYDTDFHNCDTSNPIEISAKIINFPKELLSDQKYGLHAENYGICDGGSNSETPSLTIKLSVNSALEPSWIVTSGRDQDDISISATDRGKLNCHLIADTIDQHFSWNKGSPLFLLQKYLHAEQGVEENVIIEALRMAKVKIDEADFESLAETTRFVEQQAKTIGINLQGAGTTLDARDLNIKDGRVSLHDGTIPFRVKGKGTKRLASLAIQSALTSNAPSKGIILVDEIEQGLEPDRIKHLVRYLKEEDLGQVFLTTHSRDAVQEFGHEPIVHLIKNPKTNKIETKRFFQNDEYLQRALRAYPEAFFAEKVIVCEGATEVGICRALDAWRLSKNQNPMAFENCAYIDGTGSELASRVLEINKVGIKTALLCDSDDGKINAQKSKWSEAGVKIVDCDKDKCLEQQVFNDLPWSAVIDLYDYALETHKAGDATALNTAISSKLQNGTLGEKWRETDCAQVRHAMATASIASRSEWFKSVGHGEELGKIIFKYIAELPENSRLKKSLLCLNCWIDGQA